MFFHNLFIGTLLVNLFIFYNISSMYINILFIEKIFIPIYYNDYLSNLILPGFLILAQFLAQNSLLHDLA